MDEYSVKNLTDRSLIGPGDIIEVHIEAARRNISGVFYNPDYALGLGDDSKLKLYGTDIVIGAYCLFPRRR